MSPNAAEEIVGRPASSRQSRICATVDGPPEYSRSDGEVRSERNEGVRTDSVR
jgi:hypothetical protein